MTSSRLSAADAQRFLDGLAADRLYAAEQDMWLSLREDGLVRIGVTHLVAGHGQFMLFVPRPAGLLVARDRSLGVMETAKTAVAIHAPLSCRIVEANSAAADNIHLVVADPYGAGWMFTVEPTELERERPLLMDAAAYREWLRPRLAERLIAPIDEFRTDDFDIDPNRGY
jgi:glycine cleavage system H protein